MFQTNYTTAFFSALLEDVLQEQANRWNEVGAFWENTYTRDNLLPPVLKILCPQEQASATLSLLRQHGFTKAHIMPWYDQVAEAIYLMSRHK